MPRARPDKTAVEMVDVGMPRTDRWMSGSVGGLEMSVVNARGSLEKVDCVSSLSIETNIRDVGLAMWRGCIRIEG
jgi:hypothetical protein